MAQDNASLAFDVSGEQVATATLGEMLARLPQHELEFPDPHYGKTKRFLTFSLHDVLDLGFGQRWRSPQFTEVVFTALDGYRSLSTQAKIMEKGGFVAFRDSDRADGWEPIGRKKADPAPFYIVWTGAEQTTANEWPWQLSAIAILRFEDQYPNVYPEGADENSAAFRGFLTFKGRCFHCHSMNQQGGKIGPDLNAPQSIVPMLPT